MKRFLAIYFLACLLLLSSVSLAENRIVPRVFTDATFHQLVEDGTKYENFAFLNHSPHLHGYSNGMIYILGDGHILDIKSDGSYVVHTTPIYGLSYDTQNAALKNPIIPAQIRGFARSDGLIALNAVADRGAGIPAKSFWLGSLSSGFTEISWDTNLYRDGELLGFDSNGNLWAGFFHKYEEARQSTDWCNITFSRYVDNQWVDVYSENMTEPANPARHRAFGCRASGWRHAFQGNTGDLYILFYDPYVMRISLNGGVSVWDGRGVRDISSLNEGAMLSNGNLVVSANRIGGETINNYFFTPDLSKYERSPSYGGYDSEHYQAGRDGTVWWTSGGYGGGRISPYGMITGWLYQHSPELPKNVVYEADEAAADADGKIWILGRTQPDKNDSDKDRHAIIKLDGDIPSIDIEGRFKGYVKGKGRVLDIMWAGRKNAPRGVSGAFLEVIFYGSNSRTFSSQAKLLKRSYVRLSGSRAKVSMGFNKSPRYKYPYACVDCLNIMSFEEKQAHMVRMFR